MIKSGVTLSFSKSLKKSLCVETLFWKLFSTWRGGKWRLQNEEESPKPPDISFLNLIQSPWGKWVCLCDVKIPFLLFKTFSSKPMSRRCKGNWNLLRAILAFLWGNWDLLLKAIRPLWCKWNLGNWNLLVRGNASQMKPWQLKPLS